MYSSEYNKKSPAKTNHDSLTLETGGMIVIDKPQDFTSFDVVNKMRHITKIKSIGHTGTLDPMATGVLPLLIGKCTRLLTLLPFELKQYTAEFKLGITTDTLDITGKVLSTSSTKVTKQQLTAAMQSFKGEVVQTPPMYSAIKVGGKKLYEYARMGQQVKIPSRKVNIFDITLINFNDIEKTATIDVVCSGGTYIRTLCSDIGLKLGCGATVTKLRRTMSNGFSLKHSLSPDEVKKRLEDSKPNPKQVLSHMLIKPSEIFASTGRINLTKEQTTAFLNGVKLDTTQLDILPGKENYDNLYKLSGSFNFSQAERQNRKIAVYNADNIFIGIALIDPSGIINKATIVNDLR